MAAFSLNIQKHVEPGLVTCGKFDGSHACLAMATFGGNILVHSPHRQPQIKGHDHEQSDRKLAWSGELAELQIGTEITALCTGRFNDDERDVLLIGTASHVLAYHIEDNSDIFYKEMSDGARCIIIGKLGWLPNQVAIVGGNCSVTILDAQGTEIFWTVAEGIVSSLAIFDFDGDNENELITGTQDFEIKVYKEENVLWEAKETAPITTLTGLPNRRFVYSVGNGTLGVYEMAQRLWRVKSKHRVVVTRSFDVNGDGTPEVITGWNNGKVDARSSNSGEVFFKVQLSTGIAGIVEADYRRIGKPDLVVVSTSGDVRGYGSGSTMDTPEPGEAMRDLLAKKQVLQMELRQRAASVPNMYHRTKLAVSIMTTKGAAIVGLASGPGLLIHCAIVFTEGVFDGETLVVHPSKPRGELEIEIKPSKNAPVDIHVKVCVGPAGADLLQVFEMTRQLPRFCMYEMIGKPDEVEEDLTKNFVTAEFADRPQRIALWLNQSLILPEELEIKEDGQNSGGIQVWLRGMRDNKIHCFKADTTGRVTIQTEDSTFAGDIIQSLALYLGLRELSSEVSFPEDEKMLLDALERVRDLKEIDARLQAEAASDTTLLKNIIIRLEDARILENVEEMRKRLVQLKNINVDLIREHEIRMKSYRELSANLKELNLGVQRAARLRVGKNASNMVARCRAAIQDNNPKALTLAIRHG
ncbi:PREDICTED: Bardet-Biedl syndrome 2 protein homolog [Dufourea novaeangliae]|uniref:Bardet-Biedl syndrome 2 protein homolog n=1 Tax=Dufourea novaeangliae TaxID=178035 RepID=A0A154P754_DUFNO|nr:PREDICTED: Bardet-Biedl syndrome 2 protein homolog [Dufourea novaeangliae]KZC07707.1 Bardet-Biedl syndrome 2 protein like protein [Dufourea novaeangliae]